MGEIKMKNNHRIPIETKDFLIFHCFIGKFYPYSIVTLLLHCNMLYVTMHINELQTVLRGLYAH